jgi:predicted secreted protein
MYTGLTGKVVIGNEVVFISNWSVESSREVIEFSVLGQRTREKRAGLTGWTASADGTITFEGANSHASLFNAMNAGQPVRCEFYLFDPTKVNGSTTAAVRLHGQGLIESLSVDLSAEDKGNISISISGFGELDFNGKTPTQVTPPPTNP